MNSRKEYHRQYYLDNRQRKLDATNKRREISRVFIWEYKSKHPCVRCGFSNPAALDFHHRNPNEKDIGIGDAVSNGWTIAQLEAEIAKCDILCANCHRIEHSRGYACDGKWVEIKAL